MRSCARERQPLCAGDERTQYDLPAEGLRNAQPPDGDDYTWARDLRTGPEREADTIAQLTLRVDNLVDVAERQAQRIARLEAKNAALCEAVTLHADLLQHYRLTAGI